MQTVKLTKRELSSLLFAIGNGYGDGDLFQEGLLDKKADQNALRSGWDKLRTANGKENNNG